MNNYAQHWVNLSSARLGAVAISCSDDFFAPMHRMLSDLPPTFIEDKYDDHGKWMDGWESRRKRGPGNDWCITKLARPGVLHGVEIDTSHFTGNNAPAASLEGCLCEEDVPPVGVEWTELVPKSELGSDDQFEFEITATDVFSHVRLHIYPDGGIARLRIFGEPKVDWKAIADTTLVDLAASLNGAVALVCNDQHYGNMRNLLDPGRASSMAEGWETRRRREPGNDWVIIALAHPGVIRQVEIDTAHFKGNYPDRVDLRGAMLRTASLESLPAISESWSLLLPEQKLEADQVHVFDKAVNDIGPISHVRMNIHPDGGVSRLRLFGNVSGEH